MSEQEQESPPSSGIVTRIRSVETELGTVWRTISDHSKRIDDLTLAIQELAKVSQAPPWLGQVLEALSAVSAISALQTNVERLTRRIDLFDQRCAARHPGADDPTEVLVGLGGNGDGHA